MLSKNGVELQGGAPTLQRMQGSNPPGDPLRRGIWEVPMRSENPVILLVGSDPDVLSLRSAVLASAGMWSLRARNADQAIALLGKVACELAVICYTLDDENQLQLFSFLLRTHSEVKALWMVPGDDCSGTGFLMKVEDALEERPPIPVYRGSPQPAASLG